MLIHTHQLNAQQLTELDTLCAKCQAADGNIVAIYKHLLNQNRPLPSTILCYRKNQLIGFLSAYFFYEDACEVAVMVSPSFRRKGVATQMLQEILPLIHDQQMKTLIFSTPNDLHGAWLSKHGFCYKTSEYQMQRLQSEPINIVNDAIIMHLATLADLSALCAIEAACFPSQPSNISERMQHLLMDPNYKIFVAQKGGESIGKTHLYWQPDNVRLTDIAILPAHQRCGFGSAMIAHCVRYCLEAHRHNINLDVETTNQPALKLYIQLGFVINNAYDFWTIPLEAMSKILTHVTGPHIH